MIYDENKHDFNLFLKNWNPENEYAIYGASKDCVQLIESFNFLLKKNKLKLKYIIDDNKESLGVYKNIYDINSASLKPENYKEKHVKNNLKVVSFNDYMMDKDQKKLKIIIASDFNYNKIKKFLLSKNFVEDVDFITTPGTSDERVHRPGGPTMLITNLCVMQFLKEKKSSKRL